MGAVTKTFSESDFTAACCSRSLSARRQAFCDFLEQETSVQCKAAMILLKSEYRDLHEAILNYCSEDVVSDMHWRAALKNAISDENTLKCRELCQGLLVIYQRLPEFDPEVSAFCQKCLEHEDADVRYQAYCLAELHEISSDEYLDCVRMFLESSDEDMRIISIQALARLKPEWAMKKLDERAEMATGVEAFHILLSQIHLCDEKSRPLFAQKLAVCVENERFAFAAVQALYEFGDESVVPTLLRYARSILSEPTTRIAAAAAAAKLGSQEGIKILQKFASSRHGNPNYAQEQLAKFGL